MIINLRAKANITRLVLGVLGVWISSSGVLGEETLISQGEYIFRASGCLSCHTDVMNNGPELAGGRALRTTFGTFYSPNITPDVATGIGSWTDQEFLRALREGISPSGEFYYPAFPYTSYTFMTDSDALALKAYIFSRLPVVRENVAHDIVFPANIRDLLFVWRILFFSKGPISTMFEATSEVVRGAYVVDALAHCGECHTPRNVLGSVVASRYLSGAVQGGVNGEVAPNLTPHSAGLLSWDQEDIIYFLRSGVKPNYDNVQGSMAEAIKHGLSFLTDADLKAISSYLMTIPPIPTAHRRD